MKKKGADKKKKTDIKKTKANENGRKYTGMHTQQVKTTAGSPNFEKSAGSKAR